MSVVSLFAAVIGVCIGMGLYIDHRRRRTFQLPPIEDDPRFEPARGYKRGVLEPWLDAYADNNLKRDGYFGPDGGTTIGERKRRVDNPFKWFPG